MTGTFLDASWHRVSGLKPRLRRHLAVNRHRYRGASWYVVEDKASGRVHRFTPAVYLLVGQMNGQRTVDEIWQYIVKQLGDDAPTQGEVIQLLSQLSAADLLQTDIAPRSCRDDGALQQIHARPTAWQHWKSRSDQAAALRS